jgi:maleylpyruvate isomerase
MDDDDIRALDATVAGCASAHQALLAQLDALLADGTLSDERVGAPSLLEGWTVGHVLTHIARNAEGFTGILAAADRGEIVDQYEGGVEGRVAGIEAGAGRPAIEQVADVRRTIWALEQQIAVTTIGWEGSGRGTHGDLIPCVDLPFRRWREVEIHHVDLGLPGFTYDDWPVEYVREELRRHAMVAASRSPMGVGGTRGLPDGALAMPEARRLAWLTGRLVVADLPTPPPFP